MYRYEASIHNGQMFFPADNILKGNEGNAHNYHFTYEIATKFIYTDPATRDETLVLNFAGDDDVWVFINGKLVIDLGGVHTEATSKINVDAMAAELGLVPGGLYDFNFFFAERHTTHSNLTLETNLPFLSSQYD
jgi:fibro-slime domain-containing protein